MYKTIKIKVNLSDRIVDWLILLLVTIALIVVSYPLLYVLSSSFSSVEAILSGRVKLWPVGFNLNGYKAVINYNRVARGILNSVIYASLYTLLSLFLTTIAAYPLSRKDFRPRNIIMYIFAFTMYFGGGLIPYYVVIKTLGFVNTPFVMFIPGAMSVFNVILMRTYIQNSIPASIQESSQIDGCSDIRFLSSILVPLSKPILAVIALYCAVGSWNDYFTAMIFLSNDKLNPIQIVLKDILVMSRVDPIMYSKIRDPTILQNKVGLEALLKYSLIVVSSLPILAVYPFVQKYFVKGVTLGAIKG